MVRNNTCKCMPTLCQKIHMDSCMRAYSTVQHLLCHGGYCELILSLARTSCRLLFTARPTARSLAALRDVVCSRNPSKSTPAHDAVATAVLHKHHPIIRVGAGLIQFVYRSHLRLATEAARTRNAFSPFFPRVFKLAEATRTRNAFSPFFPRVFKLAECHSIRLGASGLPYYCAPLVCASEVIDLLAVWWYNKPKTKNLIRKTITVDHPNFSYSHKKPLHCRVHVPVEAVRVLD